METIRMTVAAAIVRFLDNQYVSFDKEETKFVEGIFTIFGHGNVVGLGQALDENPYGLTVYQGRNEQGMAHTAAALAKQHKRRKIIVVTSSVGPGAANMVTAAADATVNNIPLLLLPGDVFATRQPDPVLQQLERDSDLTISTNDAFRPVCNYFDRIQRPEQTMSALINGMRVLTDPEKAGAVCIALPQDVQGECYDFPVSFFKKRVHVIRRAVPTQDEIEAVSSEIQKAKRPLIICGGGVRYSEAGAVLMSFAKEFNIPYAETQAGKSATLSSCEYNLGGIGVTGNYSANTIAKDCDVVIAVGTRLSDFTTSSKSAFLDAKITAINVSAFHGEKLEAVYSVGDAKLSLEILAQSLRDKKYKSAYKDEIKKANEAWDVLYTKLSEYYVTDSFEPIVTARNESSIDEFRKLTKSEITQTAALAIIRNSIDKDAIICGASGSLPGCLQRMWKTDSLYSYNMEYGYSCMGYEISGALGCKIASPDKESYAMVGDGSFQMLHTGLITSIMEKQKITILLFDNCGFGCINNLQMSNGIGSLATEFRFRAKNNSLNGDLVLTDYAMIAKGYGAVSYTVKTLDELKEALADSKKQTKSTLIDIKVLPKTMTGGYESWWHVGIASISAKEGVQKAFKDKEEYLKKIRKY